MGKTIRSWQGLSRQEHRGKVRRKPKKKGGRGRPFNDKFGKHEQYKQGE